MSKESKNPCFEIASYRTFGKNLSMKLLQHDGRMDLSKMCEHKGIAWICSTCGDITWEKSKTCRYCEVNGLTKTKWFKVWVVTYAMRKKLLRRSKS